MPSRYPPPSQIFPRNSGIAIGPILFVVAILAILAAAIAAGSGSFTGGTNNESASAQASAIMSYADTIAAGVQRVIVENNCAPTQISFSNPFSTAYYGAYSDSNSGVDVYANPNAPSDGSCNLFSVNGGGVQYNPFPTSWYAIAQGYFADQYYSTNAVNSVGTGAQSLFLIVRGIEKATCQKINSNVGIQSNLGATYYALTNPFTGSYSGSGGPFAGEFSGHTMGCYSFDGTTEYDFYDEILIQ